MEIVNVILNAEKKYGIILKNIQIIIVTYCYSTVDNETFENFVAKGRRNGEYADNEAVIAACEVYQINIIVHELTQDKSATRVAFDLTMPNMGGFENWQFGELATDRVDAFANVPTIEVTRHPYHYNLIPNETDRNLIDNQKNPTLNIAQLKRNLFEVNNARFDSNLLHDSNIRNDNNHDNDKKNDCNDAPPNKRRKISTNNNNGNVSNCSAFDLFDDDPAKFEAALNKIFGDANASASTSNDANCNVDSDLTNADTFDNDLSNDNNEESKHDLPSNYQEDEDFDIDLDPSNSSNNSTNEECNEIPNRLPSVENMNHEEIYSLPNMTMNKTRYERPYKIGYKVISSNGKPT